MAAGPFEVVFKVAGLGWPRLTRRTASRKSAARERAGRELPLASSLGAQCGRITRRYTDEGRADRFAWRSGHRGSDRQDGRVLSLESGS